MMILRRKTYSGYSEAAPSGTTYHSAQILNAYEEVAPPKTKKVIQGVKGGLQLVDILPTEEDYIRANAYKGASEGGKIGKKVGKILSSDSPSSPKGLEKVLTLAGQGIGSLVGVVRGKRKAKERRKKE